MQGNVMKGMNRRDLYDKCTVFMSDCLPIFNPDHLIVGGILDCVTAKKRFDKTL